MLLRLLLLYNIEKLSDKWEDQEEQLQELNPDQFADNITQIPQGTSVDVIVGQGNIVSYLSLASANTIFTITELGMPHANSGTSGVNPTPAANPG